MGFFVVVVNGPAADGERSLVINGAAAAERFGLQGDGQVDGLKGGAGFIEILHSPFAKQAGLELPKPVGVIGGHRGQGQQLAVAGIHHQGRPPFGLPLLNLTQQFLLRDPLQARVEGELQAQVIAMHAAGADAIGQGGAITAAADAELQLLAAQLVIKAQFQPGLG